MKLKAAFALFLCSLLSRSAFSAFESNSDTLKCTVISLDSLNSEDSALLAQYRDSFELELLEFKDLQTPHRKKQIDTTVAAMNRASHAEIGLDVAGPLLSYGRKSGLTGAAFYPYIMYYHKTGLYASATMGFYTDSAIRSRAKVPLFIISAGFNRKFFRKWVVEFNYSRYFVFYVKDFQKGLLNNAFSAGTSFDFWNYITLSASASIYWSSNLNSRKYVLLDRLRVPYRTLTNTLDEAYSASVVLSIYKDFSFFNIIGAKVFSVTPQFAVLLGRDNRTLLTRVYGRPLPALTYDKFFGLLDIEPGLSIDWRIRNLEIFGSFHCAIPFNVFDEGTQERIQNPHYYYPYGEGGIKYLFRIKKKAVK